MRTIQYTIEPEDTGKKVEEFLMKKQGFSRRVITALKKLPEGMLLNGVHTRTVDLLQAGDLLEINLPETAKRMPLCEIPVDILLEDEDVIVYNKPAGMPVHQSGGHIFGTLDGVYAAHCAATGPGDALSPHQPAGQGYHRSGGIGPEPDCRGKAVEGCHQAVCGGGGGDPALFPPPDPFAH